jgi:hypothetical protein
MHKRYMRGMQCYFWGDFDEGIKRKLAFSDQINWYDYK